MTTLIIAIAIGYPLGKLAEYAMWRILSPITRRIYEWEQKKERARCEALRAAHAREMSRG